MPQKKMQCSVPHSASSKKGRQGGLSRYDLSRYAVTDPELEDLDPTPILEEVFADCDERFFDKQLYGKVSVKWSGPCMTK
jgi:hypothetical protein